ncbi:hypothetical protein PUR34_17820 [Streptomyces sp. JV185]|uniref:hypothetical protein n=1 Tax=Streptomyces sp. JV185 TaxID=858638 RepID=UPI002E75EE0C|nr:hypothetical protein [Streptomyces sp. JV185]MEE1769955.1 hypothetical protein [Streptomyces sp. JV185]
MRRSWNWFKGLSEAGKIGLIAALVTTAGGGVFGLINALIPVLADGGTDDGSEAAPESSAHASQTPNSTVPSASTTPSANQPAGSDSPELSGSPAPSATLSPDSNAIQYTGTVRIAYAGPDLDVVPPKIDEYDNDVHLGLVEPPRISTSLSSSALALWSDSTMPSRQQCSDLISTQAVELVEVKKGTVVCLRTDAGRIVVLTVTSTSNGFGSGEMAQVTVWSEASD